MRLLIIDDSENDRVLVRRLLPQTIEAGEAKSLAEAFAILARGDWQPDAILLDLHLPDGDGPAGEAWGAVPGLSAHAPVIVVTAQSLADDPFLGRRAKEAGAAGFTSKEIIIFSPESLARQLDWAVSAVSRSLAAAVTNAAAPELGPYDPNSLPALIARIIFQQDSMHAENQTAAIQRKEQLDRIESQVKATNGRVTKVEEWQADKESKLKAGKWVASGVCLLVWFFFGPQLKERLTMDRATVKEVVEVQLAIRDAKGGTVPPSLTSPP